MQPWNSIHAILVYRSLVSARVPSGFMQPEEVFLLDTHLATEYVRSVATVRQENLTKIRVHEFKNWFHELYYGRITSA